MQRFMRSPTNTAIDTADYPKVFRAALDSFGTDPAQILTHHDADGLSSGAILARALSAVGRHVHIRIVGRAENPWSDEIRAELRQRNIGGLIVADLGVRSGVLCADTPTIVLDHHVPQGTPEGAVVISGFGMSPTPTTSLLAYRCAAAFVAARDEVRAELARVRRTAPRIAGSVALVCFASACQIHPLIAQMWSARMKGRVVIAANTGFRPGWVHFAARSAEEFDLVQFLRDRAPPGADAHYGGGHRRASGGALRLEQWNDFLRTLGFTREMDVKP